MITWSLWSCYDWLDWWWLMTVPSCRAQVVHQSGWSREVLDCQPRRRAQRSVFRFPHESARATDENWGQSVFLMFPGVRMPSATSGVEMPPFRQAFEWRVVGGPAIRKRKRKVDRANFKLQIQGNRCWAAFVLDFFERNASFCMVGSPPCLIHRFPCLDFSRLVQSFNISGFRMFMSTIIKNLQMSFWTLTKFLFILSQLRARPVC